MDWTLQPTRIRKAIGRRYWDHYGKDAFVKSCPAGARLLDVGCGNNSPSYVKMRRPDLHYTGIDIGDYNQSEPPDQVADRYIVVPPQDFASKIRDFQGTMDAVLSSHNIEHCDDPDATVAAMADALAPGGRLFMAFPCEASVRFPSRRGTLNFFDDPTHKTVPQFAALVSGFRSCGLEVPVAIRRYRPLVNVLKGLRAEPVSWLQRRVFTGTWALYGFESIIWAVRPA